MMQPRTERPPHIHPPMAVSDRAKQFAPFAALGRLDDTLKAVEEGRDIGDYIHESNLEDFNYIESEDNEIELTDI